MNKEAIVLVGELIRDAMGLSQDRIFTYNQDYKLPNDDDIFIVLEYNNSKPYSVTKDFLLLGDNTELWSAERIYVANDIIRYDIDGLFYRCLNPNVQTVPTDITDWENIAQNFVQQTMKAMENYTINIVSKNSDARKRKEEVIFALTSTISEEAQALHAFKIYPIASSFINLSAAEGGSMLNRFAININVLTWYILKNNITYYENFTNSIIN